ncbi:MAG: mechanosensitive ion channel family protein [Bacilli bacterium]|nr:mechanosensitive ion channel family protein [Bacilli bacterium]
MVYIKDIFNSPLIIKILSSIIVGLIGLIVYLVFSNILSSKVSQGKIKIFSTKRGKTYLKMVKNITKYGLVVIIILIILHIFGIDITSMIASVGVISIIIGFAVQDALKDIIKGFDIISDNYYRVGDVIKFGDITGKVLTIGLKTTKIQDITSLNIVSISNRNIEQVEIVSNLINIDIPLPYELKIEEAEKAIHDIINNLKKEKEIENVEYRGVNDLAESCIKYQIKVYCNPVKKIQIRRDCLRCIIIILDKHNISIPYNQLDIHKK